eukprot:CAMPEP_0171458416 /NCGR_PEP_ID=MMETSP0945-20130129/4104_1 /TAXON_ID=109269 /ORGANISM="Vaucheria litorea, Strain CCMP2940" /LENGTH=256 /DNA_ID=CAMNT_0011984221 /DNA_START=285 /DNA_END=1051 /DNA_ORIENTATION=+
MLFTIKVAAATVILLYTIVLTPNSYLAPWVESSKPLTLVWFIFQGIAVLDFAYAVHDIMNINAEKSEENGNKMLAFFWRISYLAGVIFFAYIALKILKILFYFHVNCEDLDLEMMIYGTFAWGFASTVISMTTSVGTGLLPPSIALAYSSLLAWYYVPPDKTQQLRLGNEASFRHDIEGGYNCRDVPGSAAVRVPQRRGPRHIGQPAHIPNRSRERSRLLVPPQGYVSEGGVVDDIGMSFAVASIGLAMAFIDTDW